MKSPANYSLLTKALLLVSFGFFTGGLPIAQASGDRITNGPARPGALSYRNAPAESYLLVYSATDESRDGDLAFYAHSSYVIYATDEKFLRNVENHMSPSDELPDLVKLPAGTYTIEARSADDRYVRVRVVISAGRRTTAYLDGEV